MPCEKHVKYWGMLSLVMRRWRGSKMAISEYMKTLCHGEAQLDLDKWVGTMERKNLVQHTEELLIIRANQKWTRLSQAECSSTNRIDIW